jgi:hypothetical protein
MVETLRLNRHHQITKENDADSKMVSMPRSLYCTCLTTACTGTESHAIFMLILHRRPVMQMTLDVLAESRVNYIG